MLAASRTSSTRHRHSYQHTITLAAPAARPQHPMTLAACNTAIRNFHSKKKSQESESRTSEQRAARSALARATKTATLHGCNSQLQLYNSWSLRPQPQQSRTRYTNAQWGLSLANARTGFFYTETGLVGGRGGCAVSGRRRPYAAAAQVTPASLICSTLCSTASATRPPWSGSATCSHRLHAHAGHLAATLPCITDIYTCFYVWYNIYIYIYIVGRGENCHSDPSLFITYIEIRHSDPSCLYRYIYIYKWSLTRV